MEESKTTTTPASVGRGVLMCKICDESLSMHSFTTHAVSEIFVEKMKLAGFPHDGWKVEPALAQRRD